MTRYIVQRLVMTLPMLLAISIITFTFINLAPGDPIMALVSPEDRLRESDLQRMRENLGLKRPANSLAARDARHAEPTVELANAAFG